MARFVLLEHDHPHRHWDLMLEAGPVLRTWRLAAPPAPGQVVPAEPSFDHRLLYLDYEGPISGNRGQVLQHDRGTYDFLLQEADEIGIRLRGETWQGVLRLRKEAESAWSATFTSDPVSGDPARD
jgi:hypothetical protein